MERYMYSSRPIWIEENADGVQGAIVETAMVKGSIPDGAEYRRAVCDGPEAKGLKNNPDSEGAE